MKTKILFLLLLLVFVSKGYSQDRVFECYTIITENQSPHLIWETDSNTEWVDIMGFWADRDTPWLVYNYEHLIGNTIEIPFKRAGLFEFHIRACNNTKGCSEWVKSSDKNVGRVIYQNGTEKTVGWIVLWKLPAPGGATIE